MSQEQKKVRYPLTDMVDNLGKPPKEVVEQGKALLARMEHRAPHEKKAEEAGSIEANRRSTGRTDHTQQFLPPHEMSFDEANKVLNAMLPQAAARRTSQSAELTALVGPLRSSVPVVARNPTLADQLGKLR